MKRLWVVGVGLVAAVLVAVSTWVVAAQVLQSPAEVAAQAEAPEPGPVTAPVERRTLEAEVIVRGTVRFDEPIEISLLGAPAVDGEAVATWLPEEDAQVADGDVLLEASGRPVFAVEGALPAYRDLRPGMSGDDVEQLQESLARLGYDPGDIDGSFGAATETALSEWYEDAGYEAPGPSAEERERLDSAEEAVATAREQLRQAEERLEEAGEGPRRSEVLQAESRVNDAEERLADAEEAGQERDARAARDELAIAEASLDELLADPDTSAQEQAVAEARDEVAEASERFEEIEAETGVWMPAGEIVYVEELPQRVQDVAVSPGESVSGMLMTMTSAEVVVESAVPARDVELVNEGDTVLVGDGEERFEGIVSEVAERPGTDGASDDRHRLLIEPDGAAEDFLDGSLRVVIPVESTDGEVLAVPLPALSAGGNGDSRVEVVEDDAGGEEPSTRIVAVEPGLSTDGMVEVTPTDSDLDEGDQVIVGRAGADAEEAEEEDEE